MWCNVGQSWDTVVPQNINDLFHEWNGEKNVISNVKLGRCIFTKSSHSNVELHTLVDASQAAMCVVIYARSMCNEEVFVNFVVGKCRVAPIRSSTIPKLELQAALIGMRLCTSVKSLLPFDVERCWFWSDSSTVIHWIDSSHKKLLIFVANRVAEILDNTTVDQWRFVPGILKPADLGTRGLKYNEIMSSEWLTGASFLKLDQNQWPKTELPIQ